jgi:hypothetical protein
MHSRRPLTSAKGPACAQKPHRKHHEGSPESRSSRRWPAKWPTVDHGNSRTPLHQELLPVSVTIRGKAAVVQYRRMVANKDFKNGCRTPTGPHTDAPIKENRRWRFISWADAEIDKN